MAGVGPAAGLQPAGWARWIVVVFPAGLLLGFAAGLLSGWTDDPLRIDAALMISIGLLTATAWRVPGPLLLLLAFGVALFRGAANASGVDPATDLTLFACGMAAAGYAALTLLTALVELFRGSGAGWQSIAVRAGGSWIAAIGVMVGGYTFRM